MNILSWIVLGGLAGWIASIIMGKNASMGIVANIAVGIVGGLLGGFLATLLGGQGVNEFSFRNLVIAVVGSVILLAIAKMFGKK